MKNVKKGLYIFSALVIVFGLSFLVTSTVQAGTNLTIAKAVDKDTAMYGDQITYTIDAYNSSGNNYCDGATLTITDDITNILANADLVDTDATSQDGHVLTWVFENVACGEQVTGHLVVEIHNRAMDGAALVNGAEVDDNNGNNITSLKVSTDIKAPLISVIKSVDKTLASPSDTLTYTVTVSNSGSVPATNLVLTDVLPAGLTFADTSFKDTTVNTWNLGDLAAGGDVTIKYDVLVDSQAGTNVYDNQATASADNHHPVTANVSTDVRIPVVLGETAPSLTIEKSVAESFVNPGGTVAYTVKVTNDGNAPAMNVVLEDVLPAGFVYAGTSNQTTASWKLGDIVPTESVTRDYEVTALSNTLPGNYFNTATVSADNVDGVSAKASLEVKELQVLGAEDELPVTGGGLALILGSLMLAGTGIAIRRKLK